MIGSLRGRILHKQAPALQIDVGGVGYEIEAPMTTFYNLPSVGDEVYLFTHLVVRDDAHLLFGFASQDERALFRALIRVNGVGARMALTILSGMTAGEFARCVRERDTACLVRLPGVGKKTAERLVIEMKDRLHNISAEDTAAASGGSGAGTDAASEAISALIALGYKPQEASRYVHAVAADGMDSEQIIREALKASVR